MIALLLLAATADDPALTRAALRLAPEQPCKSDPDTTDVTVCGRRRADRFRVPFNVAAPGDPRHEGVSAERERLLHRTTPLQEMSPFLVGGGMTGASVTVGSGRVRTETLRKPAP
jgi:hypothetical protein